MEKWEPQAIVTGTRVTVNSLIFAGINVWIFETKPYSRGLIFAVGSGLVNYLGTHELCLWVFIFAS